MCRTFFVEGRVQGVFFRVSTARVAGPMGIVGSAVNLDDGRVCVTACGGTDELMRLEQWLSHGPPGAKVTDLRASASECVPATKFVTG